MGDVPTYIIAPMEALYTRFDTDDADLVIDSYITALHEFSNETLQQAYAEVVRNFIPYSRTPCPSPAHFVQAARKILSGSGSGMARDEIRDAWRRDGVEDKKAADKFVIESSSTLVAMALRDGWSRSLRDVAADVIRKFRELHGRRPTDRELLGFRLPQDDVDYYKKNGQPFTAAELDRVLSERAKLGHKTGAPQ